MHTHAHTVISVFFFIIIHLINLSWELLQVIHRIQFDLNLFILNHYYIILYYLLAKQWTMWLSFCVVLSSFLAIWIYYAKLFRYCLADCWAYCVIIVIIKVLVRFNAENNDQSQYLSRMRLEPGPLSIANNIVVKVFAWAYDWIWWWF